MKSLFLGAAAAAAAAAAFSTPLAAQAPSPAAATAPVVPAPEPQRLAIATDIAAAIFPPGSFKQMMERNFAEGGGLSGFLDMPVADIVPPDEEASAQEQETARVTMRELMLADDPHFVERTEIVNRVMMTEMVGIISALEPRMRAALATAYARKFTVPQLTDIRTFFASSSGRVYAAESMLIGTDPEFMKAMAGAAPEIMRAMPALQKKVEEATAHLPPARSEEADAAVEGKRKRKRKHD